MGKQHIIMVLAIIALIMSACSSHKAPPPNVPFDVQENQPVLSPVDVVFINDSSCEGCQSAQSLAKSLVDAKINIGKILMVNYNTTQGHLIIVEYNITRVPAALISSEIVQYSGIGRNFLQAVPVEGFYSILSPPPYRDLSTGRIRGKVNMTFLTDSSCLNCFGIDLMKKALASLGLKPDKEITVDIASEAGQLLAEKYKIKAIPAAFLTGDVVVYGTLNDAWTEVGTVEKDGTYVFRNHQPLGQGIVYRDLITGQIYNQTKK
jgi:hypothetical protein